MKEIRIGRPTVTAEGRKLLLEALDAERISEGVMTERLERKLADLFGASDAVAVNSGHSALYVALRAARDLHGCRRVVTTSLTFSSTVSAALEAGLLVECVDVEKNGFLLDTKQAAGAIKKGRENCAYVPVHLFGYPCGEFRHGAFEVQDACEAFRTKRGGRPVGLPSVGCLSFYTSHVLGCGELGAAVFSSRRDALYARSLKDQGRRHIRPPSHVDRMTHIPPFERYAHDRAGWNFRTTDLQTALILGALPALESVVQRRAENILFLNRKLLPYSKWMSLPRHDRDVSYLAYPIICVNPRMRDVLVRGLELRGIETRPFMSLIPEEGAFRKYVRCPFGYDRARDVHSRGFYISCHDSMTAEDIEHVGRTFGEILG